MKNKKIKINDSFIVNALRNCGYNNYSALSDIIDNSLEPEVNSTYVKVDFETEGTGADKTIIKSILVIDDGCGMSSDILEEAMSLGSETGKNGSDNLGMYGAGMKTASFSIGQKLEVFSKMEGEELNHSTISLEDTINNGGEILVDYVSYAEGTEKYKWFKSMVGAEHGTIVKISVLDKLTNKNYQNFKGVLKNKISENFNKFIYADVVKFYVRKDEVPYTDLMGETNGSEFLGEGTFEVDGHEIKYRAWSLREEAGNDRNNVSEEHVAINNIEYLPRTKNNQGLYIYRQNRLVGKSVVLGMWSRDWWYTQFRCEIFMDGNCDYLFGTTFTKMVNESTRSTIDQSFYDKLCAEIKPYASQVCKRAQTKDKTNKENDPQKKKEREEFYKKVTERQNRNVMLRAKRKGENKPKEDDGKEHQTRGKQKNPNPVRERTNKWLDGFEECPMGRSNEMYGMEHRNGKKIITINTDHPFYQKFYSLLDEDLKFIMAQIISCEEIAKQNVNYYGADDVRDTIDMYNEFQSSEVSKSLCF